VTEY